METNPHLDRLRFSLFRRTDRGHCWDPIQHISFSQLVDLYNSEEVRKDSNAVRSCTDNEEQGRLKSWLWSISCHGAFSYKNNDGLIHHNDHLLVIDIDGLRDQKEAIALRDHFAKLKCCCMSVVSPKSKGVKGMFIMQESVTPDNRHKTLQHNTDVILKGLRLHSSVKLDHMQFVLSQAFYVAHDPFTTGMYVNWHPVPKLFGLKAYQEPQITVNKSTIKAADIPKDAQPALDAYVTAAYRRVINELNAVPAGAARHPNIVKVANVAELIHYAPGLEVEFKQGLLDAVVELYGGHKEAKQQNAYRSFDDAWNKGLRVRKQVPGLEDKIREYTTTNTTTK